MRIRSRHLAAGIAFLALLAPSVGGAQSATAWRELASGEPGRTYHEIYAPALIKRVPAFRIRNRATTGSNENLDLLANRKADLGFAQLDIYAMRLRKEPKRYGEVTVVGRLGEECVYLAYRRAGPMKTFAGLGAEVEGRKARIAVGPDGGGMSGTWTHLAALDPALEQAEVSHTGGALALNQLSLGMFDAVGWVTAPHNVDHVLLRGVLANDDLDLLGIPAAKFAEAKAGGIPVYQTKTLTLNDRKPPRTLDTICTNAAVFARPGAQPDLVEAASQALSLHREEILDAAPKR